MSDGARVPGSHRLIVELTAPPEGRVGAFNEWYDRQVMPRRRVLDGVASARRYREAGNDTGWLAVYGVTGEGVLPEPPGTLPEREVEMRAALARLETRQYAELAIEQRYRRDLPETGYLLAVWWTPAADTLRDFHAWYDEEHIPLLLDVPGWLAIRRYELVAGTGPRFLALHYLESPAVLAEPNHRRAVTTPWRARVALHREQHERRMFEVWNQ
ncbi:DUF4286 family protein [Rhizomonospora bruguierae]|uniref:DUF4286 family protein n=1 Tax=Rhizomonospora bruguierae TaxID=1581705 RepID=UPI001BCEB25F|nr:DUF4286 family protein [Micromonospora sp. NBRC 107566]